MAYDRWRPHRNTGDAGQVASSDLAMMCRAGDGFYLSSGAKLRPKKQGKSKGG